MDNLEVPHRIERKIETYRGYSREQVMNGEAEAAEEDVKTDWYEPGPDGPVKVTNPARIAELDASIVNQEQE